MIKCVEGIYKNGKVELLESLEEPEGARVLVTFLPKATDAPTPPDFTHEELVELRGKLAAWEEDWNAPGMEAYDAYEAR
jgi:hypothetical protein